MDHNTGGKWFMPGPKQHEKNQLLSLEHPYHYAVDELLISLKLYAVALVSLQ